MEVSVEALKLRRMRVRSEIALSREGGDRAEDLDALREELLRLSMQIAEAAVSRSNSETTASLGLGFPRQTKRPPVWK